VSVEKFLEAASDDAERAINSQLERENKKLVAEVARLRSKKPRSVKNLEIMVMGDAHAEYDVPNDRFDWAGRMAAELAPDVLVQIGDLADMKSLSKYDEGKKCFEGRRYWKDIDVAKDGLDRIERQIGGSKIRKVMTLGNHEDRINRIVDLEPRFDGMVSTKDLGLEERGWEVFDFLHPVEIGGFTFIHFYGPTNRFYGGTVVPARTALMKTHTPMVFGHTHRLSYADEPRADGSRIMVINCGCYFEHFEAWASPQQQAQWNRGILWLSTGTQSFRWYSMAEIRERWGG
jgi:predicted phosphodiesterase